MSTRDTTKDIAGAPQALAMNEAASMDSLPNEVLCAIFKECLPVGRPAAMASDEAPLLLTHVCSEWRALAHAMPELWVSTHLVLSRIRPGSFNQATQHDLAEVSAREDRARLPFIKEWFRRTETKPLHLSISDQMLPANVDSCITEYVLILLDRVESLDLSVCERTLQRFAKPSRGAYARLRWLRTSGDGFYPAEFTFLALGGAPLLTEFDIRALHYPVHNLPLNFDRLTRLAVSHFPNPAFRPSTSDLLRLLRRTPHLQSLRMVINGGHPVDDPKQDPIALTDLHTLQLKFSGRIDALFYFIRTPLLREIQLLEDSKAPGHGHHSNNETTEALSSIVMSQSQDAVHQISKLEIKPSDYPRQLVRKCLRKLPGLRHLVLLNSEPQDHEPSTPAILSALTPSILDPAAGLCRGLERLDIHTRSDSFDKLDCLHELRSLLRNKASASQRDPSNFSNVKTVTLPKEWQPEEGTPLAADFDLCIRQTKVALSFLGDDEGAQSQSWSKKGFWDDDWYHA